MKKFVLPMSFSFLVACLVATAGMVVAPHELHAASCESKAASVARSRGGTVLSVQTRGSSCRIKILVKSGGGAPKRITVTVPK